MDSPHYHFVCLNWALPALDVCIQISKWRVEKDVGTKLGSWLVPSWMRLNSRSKVGCFVLFGLNWWTKSSIHTQAENSMHLRFKTPRYQFYRSNSWRSMDLKDPKNRYFFSTSVSHWKYGGFGQTTAGFWFLKWTKSLKVVARSILVLKVPAWLWSKDSDIITLDWGVPLLRLADTRAGIELCCSA